MKCCGSPTIFTAAEPLPPPVVQTVEALLFSEILKPIASTATYIPESGAPVFDTPVLINTEARGTALTVALGDEPIVVMRQHGTVTVGANVEEAVIRMICAEDNARTQVRALQIGTPNYIEGSEVATLRRENLDPKIIRKFWNYWEETALRSGKLDGLASRANPQG